jgi:hypothetical protein
MKKILSVIILTLLIATSNISVYSLSNVSTTHKIGNLNVSILDTYEKNSSSEIVGNQNYDIMEFTDYILYDDNSFKGNIIDIITSEQEDAGFYHINNAGVNNFINSYTESSEKLFSKVELVSKSIKKIGMYDSIYGRFIFNDNIYNDVYCIINGKYSYTLKLYSSNIDFLDSEEVANIKGSIKIDDFVKENFINLNTIGWGILIITTSIFIYYIFIYKFKKKTVIPKSIKSVFFFILAQWLAYFGKTLNNDTANVFNLDNIFRFIGYNLFIIFALILLIKEIIKNKREFNSY